MKNIYIVGKDGRIGSLEVSVKTYQELLRRKVTQIKVSRLLDGKDTDGNTVFCEIVPSELIFLQ